MAIRRIGQILVDLGFITDEQLEMLLEEQQQRPGELLGQIAISMGLVNDDQLAQALAEQLGMQVINLGDMVIPAEVLAHVTEPMAQLYRIIPISFKRRHADGRHVRSAEAVDHRRAAQLPRLRHPARGGHREGDPQGTGALLRSRRRECRNR